MLRCKWDKKLSAMTGFTEIYKMFAKNQPQTHDFVPLFDKLPGLLISGKTLYS